MRDLWKPEERVSFALRELYQRYGYARFKMSKFEAYDLYMQNKEFLVSDGIITFTDTDGTLMALKPDVTLSIVKHFRKDKNLLQKFCYHENVYRISGAGRRFREIMQTGLECIGDVGLYELCEVVLLAAKSLQTISYRFILEVSHLDILSRLLSQYSLSESDTADVINAFAEKNEDALNSLLPAPKAAELIGLMRITGPILPALEQIKSYTDDDVIGDLRALAECLLQNGINADQIHLDFSIVSDRNYYNGIVFRGYVNGIPEEMLSGGQYDRLMEKMGKNARAVGFAVYLDQIEQLDSRNWDFDVDTIILYDQACSPQEIMRATATLNGSQYLVMKEVPKRMRYRKLMQLRNGTLQEVETYG